jgi:hypothetical protein
MIYGLKIKASLLGFSKSLLFLLIIFQFQSCSNNQYRSVRSVSSSDEMIINPPSMVEKIWLARTHYDADRRLIIPKVGGARWGAVQEYTAEGNLVYRDWWVRNLKLEDLEAAPSVEIQVVREEDDSVRPPILGISGIETNEPTNKNVEVIEITEPSVGDENDLAPSPFSPIPTQENNTPVMSEEGDPFAPLPPAFDSSTDLKEPDPFAPLPSPF